MSTKLEDIRSIVPHEEYNIPTGDLFILVSELDMLSLYSHRNFLPWIRWRISNSGRTATSSKGSQRGSPAS